MRTTLPWILFCTGCASCVTAESTPPPPSRYDDVMISPQDMRTGVDAREAVDGVVHSRVWVGVPDHFPHFESEELPRWDGALRLVRWPSAELVAGVWRYRDEGVEGPYHAFGFEPESGTYEEGWYAVQIDLATVGERRGVTPRDLPVIDGWTTSRFRIGSQPLIRMWGTVGPQLTEDSSSGFIIYASERIPIAEGRNFADFFEVLVDGEPHRCEEAGSYNPAFFDFRSVSCDPAPADARVHVTYRSGYFARRVWDYRADSPPSWSFGAGETPDHAGPSDALFLIDPEERR